jgi:hypothetical protein
VADVRPVLVAGSGDVEAAVAEVRSMRWEMPRLVVHLAPRKQLRALLRRELAPQILGLGRGEVYFSRSESPFGVPPSGGPNCTAHPILRLALRFPLPTLDFGRWTFDFFSAFQRDATKQLLLSENARRVFHL